MVAETESHQRDEGRRVRVPGLPEFVATADSEASDAESPHFEGDAGAEVLPDAPGGIGTAPWKLWSKRGGGRGS